MPGLSQWRAVRSMRLGERRGYFLLGMLTNFGLSLVAALGVKKLLLRM